MKSVETADYFVGIARGVGTIRARDGRYVNPIDLRWYDLRIEYMLYGLPNICRFSGQITGPTWGGLHRRVWRRLVNRTSFYSVAQHQVLGARRFLKLGEWSLARWFSIHDGPEFAMGDVARPLKYQPEMKFYRDAQSDSTKKMARRHGLTWPEPAEIKLMDNRMLATEFRDLQGGVVYDDLPEPLPFRIEPWTPARAFVEYRDILTELGFWP